MKMKMDHFYGEQAGASTDLTPIQNEINTLKQTVTNLGNITAKTNLANVFTTHQTINGYVKESTGFYKDGQSQPIATMKHQSQKDFFINFIQDTQGFRNYCNFNIRHRYGNQTDAQYTNLFQIQFRDTGTGAFITCENNKLTFGNATTIDGIATPTANNHAANKQYVDSKSVPNFTLLQEWTGNFKTTEIAWTKSAQFSTAGIYEFIVSITNGNFTYTISQFLNIIDVTKTCMGGEQQMQWTNNTIHPSQQASNGGVWLWYSNKKIGIGKVGDNQPQANTSVKIYYRKIG